MAARLSPAHDAKTREKIKTSQLINRLQEHVFGEPCMEKSQVSAAVALLKKTLPDLLSTELSGPDGSPIPVKGIVEYVD